MNSLRDGGSRTIEANPITSGAAVMMPSASEMNQLDHVVTADAAEPWNSTNPIVPPIRNRACNNRRREQTKDAAQGVEAEGVAIMTVDQPGGDQGFCRIGQGEDDGGGKIAVAQKIGDDRCPDGAGDHGKSRAGPKGDEGARGNTRRRPEHGDPIGRGQQCKAEACSGKVSNAHGETYP